MNIGDIARSRALAEVRRDIEKAANECTNLWQLLAALRTLRGEEDKEGSHD